MHPIVSEMQANFLVHERHREAEERRAARVARRPRPEATRAREHHLVRLVTSLRGG